MKHNPLYAIPKSFIMLSAGKTSSPKDRIGDVIIRDDGKNIRIFLEIQIKANKVCPAIPNGVFQVWFSTKSAPEKTIRLSRMTLFGFSVYRDFDQSPGLATMIQKNSVAFMNGLA